MELRCSSALLPLSSTNVEILRKSDLDYLSLIETTAALGGRLESEADVEAADHVSTVRASTG